MIDLTLSVKGTRFDGTEIRGVITARVDPAKMPWPEQKWDGYESGDNPLKISERTPIEVIEVLDVRIVKA